jgi:hypothetical protein
MREFEGRPGLETVSEDMLDNSALVVTLPLKQLNPALPLRMDAEQIMLLEI